MKFKKGIKERNVILKCAADFMLPFALIFGIYIILFGTVSPGGGFQGGVIVAAAVLLLYLGYGYKTTAKAIAPKATCDKPSPIKESRFNTSVTPKSDEHKAISTPTTNAYCTRG